MNEKSGFKRRERTNMELYYAFSPYGHAVGNEMMMMMMVCGGDNLEFWKRGRRKVENNNVEEKRK